MEFGQGPAPAPRLIGIGFVVIFHVALLYALVNGLARKLVTLLPPPIETRILPEIQPEQAPPPLPPPKLDAPPPPDFVPPPEVVIQQPPPAQSTAIVATTATPAAEPRPHATTAPVVVAGNCREPEYPPVSDRLGETGTVLLALMVGVDGKVSSSHIEKSSGFQRLDKAALDALSRCKFTPGSANGALVPAWANIKYTFKAQR